MIQKSKIWAVIAAFAGVLSCTDNVGDVSDISDNYSGQYICKSMRFLGSPIDINGDGNATMNLLSEYSTLPYTEDVIKTRFALRSPEHYNEEVRCNVEIPMQDVTYHKISGEYTTEEMGNDAYICFGYYVDLTGQVIFVIHNESNTNLFHSSEYEDCHLDYNNLEIQSVEAKGDGMLKLVFNSAFYDYCSNEFLEGQVESVYERVSYKY